MFIVFVSLSSIEDGKLHCKTMNGSRAVRKNCLGGVFRAFFFFETFSGPLPMMPDLVEIGLVVWKCTKSKEINKHTHNSL
jgi:hypothetical protein